MNPSSPRMYAVFFDKKNVATDEQLAKAKKTGHFTDFDGTNTTVICYKEKKLYERPGTVKGKKFIFCKLCNEKIFLI